MKKRGFLNRIWIWLLRFRYRKGYGVHSPFAFDLITNVFYGEMPFYDFPFLKEQIEKVQTGSVVSNKRYLESRNICEMLFKLVDDSRSNTILEVGTMGGAAMVYLSASRKKGRCISIDHESPANILARNIFHLCNANVDYRIGDVEKLLPDLLSELGTLDFLLLNPEEYPIKDIRLMFDLCCEKSNQNSVFVIRDIHSSRVIRKWWNQIVADEKVGITFDLYDLGIVYFDKRKIKQHYIVNY
ncbi:class I SAM-dependent methyltransferase [Bacteroides sedimenti]|uniref:Class I SAM-dependent methyltransferase n=1 Tax=Bacteroides sedimenti TaxID=2136147 RepID=A0ABM8II36_9BACE